MASDRLCRWKRQQKVLGSKGPSRSQPGGRRVPPVSNHITHEPSISWAITLQEGFELAAAGKCGQSQYRPRRCPPVCRIRLLPVTLTSNHNFVDVEYLEL